jgi:hypothetical protein
VVTGLVLVEPPPGRLFGLMVVPAARAGVAGARPAALFEGDRMLEVAPPGGPSARWPGALAVPDLYQVP